jgi:hypothetical protein
MSNTVLSHISKCFTTNKLALHLDITHVIKFVTNNSQQYELNISYDENHIQKCGNTKFLGLQTDNHLNPC